MLLVNHNQLLFQIYDDSVCNFNFLALFANKLGSKKALYNNIFVLDVTEELSEPIIPARDIISFESAIIIFIRQFILITI